MTHILEIAIPTPLRRRFDYLSEWPVKPGCRVHVPFGRRQMVGVVLGERTESNIDPDKLKTVLDVIDTEPLFPDVLFKLINWAADYYHYPIGETFYLAMPALLRQGKAKQLLTETFWQLSDTNVKPDAFKRAPKQLLALQQLQQGEQSAQILKSHDITPATLKSLADKQLIKKSERILLPEIQYKSTDLTLNTHQEQAIETLNASKQFSCFLLDGVTGSGKTEVYLRAIEHVLEQNLQALVLVPEIGLTPQTVKRFQQRLNARVASFHSGLTDSERLQTWLLARSGQVDVVIGTRSAVFMPFKQLGIIVIDEEHDMSFKQQEGFRYHARDVAVRRAHLENIPVILGSATPSLESLHNVKLERYQSLLLPERAGNAVHPGFSLIDLRQDSSYNGISDHLTRQIEATVKKGEQVLLFLNRRGFAPVFMCHDCGWMAQCHRCDAYLTLHHKPHYLHCHHCDKHYSVFTACIECHSENLHPVGVGTEKLEHAIEELFPNYNVVRVDRDTTKNKGQLDAQLEKINSGKADILIGTQMLAKGHHFPNVTLVGVLNADNGFFSVDFRTLERIGQLLIQVAGRAGRAEKPGTVFIQTYHPDHPLLQQLTQHGYPAFAQSLLEERQAAQLPPFSHYVLLRAEAHQANHAMALLQQAKQLAHNSGVDAVNVFGPATAPMEKRAGRFRSQLLLQSSQRNNLHQLLHYLIEQLDKHRDVRKVRWSVDVDPMDMN
tara:strand:- start:33238 stop:35403 length:2166 start_codon:yes stop_codon:yes gene_type:complete